MDGIVPEVDALRSRGGAADVRNVLSWTRYCEGRLGMKAGCDGDKARLAQAAEAVL